MHSSSSSTKWLRPCTQAMTLALVGLLGSPGIGWAKEELRAKDIVVNGEMRAVVPATNGTEAVRGRVSGHFAFTEESLEKGVVLVKALNWVAFGVDQQAITGIEPKGKPTAALGFTVAVKEAQILKYDGRVLSGKIKGQLSLDQFFELAPVRAREDGHDIDMTTLPAELEITIELDRPLQAPEGKRQGVESRRVNAKMVIRAEPYERLKLRKGLELKAEAVLAIDIDWIFFFEAGRSLCVQPVRIGRFNITWTTIGLGISFPTSFSFSFSGDGLAFGQPGANREWKKADIVFNYRDWITIWDSTYSTLTDAEMSSLRAEVNEDDCVEVFFVDRFDPQDMDGGGNTVSGGTESAKIISSDENADFGVDLTHLAHELGHVLTLKHPGEGFPTAAVPHRVDGSTNTLMCPSGFNNDNPARNSVWNEDNVANPLLVFSLKLPSAGPDCTNDADCGACP